jgi:hypothetical protein
MGDLADDLFAIDMENLRQKVFIDVRHRAVTDEDLEATPEPPGDLTHEEAVGWRHGWLSAQAWFTEEDGADACELEDYQIEGY